MKLSNLLVAFVLIVAAVNAADEFSVARDNKPAKYSALPDGNATKFKLSDYQRVEYSKKRTGFDANDTFYSTVDENGTVRFSEQARMAKKVVDTDTNKTYYQPNNSQMLERYKNNRANASSDFANRMTALSPSLKEVQNLRGKQLSKQNIYDKLGDSNDTRNAQKVDALMNTLQRTTIRPKTIQCFVKRELVPKYLCPLTGKSFGARFGGSPEDNQDAMKKQCGDVCKSEPYGCRKASTGGQITKAAMQTVAFDTTDPSDTASKIMFVEFDIRQKVKSAKYNTHIEWTDYAIENNLTMHKPMIEIKTSVYRLALDMAPTEEMELVSDRYPYRQSSEYGELSMMTLDGAQKAALKFYAPTLIKEGKFTSLSLKDVVKKITITGIDIEYVDNNYHFCSIGQVVNDPSSECKGGIIYDVNATDGPFRICVSDSVQHGPEPKYGAYYSEKECTDRCYEKSDCVETYEDFLTMSQNDQYKITVGCLDDTLNSHCTRDMCLDLFRGETQPLEERVYDRIRGTRVTVMSGMQVVGIDRPKVDINGELAASADTTSANPHEAVFNKETKDAAYYAMTQKRSYNYSKDTVGQGTQSENAVRLVLPRSAPGNFMTTTGSMEVYWLLKPRSVDIDPAKQFYLYVVSKLEQVYTPKSGTFPSKTIQGGTTMTTTDLFKDHMYLYLNADGKFTPFYQNEYAEVQSIDLNDTTWKTNTTNHRQRFVKYLDTNDTMVVASGDAIAESFKTATFTGDQNYEDYKVAIDPQTLFATTHGNMILSQQVVNQGEFPIKHYANYDRNTTSSIGNFRFYGIYSPVELTNAEVLEKVEGNGYEFFNALRGRGNKDYIKGDGFFDSKNVKMFIKGPSNNMKLSVELNPSIEEEEKDATLFMFLYEGN